MMDDDDIFHTPAERAWVAGQRSEVEDYLRGQNVRHGEIGGWPAWHLQPYLCHLCPSVQISIFPFRLIDPLTLLPWMTFGFRVPGPKCRRAVTLGWTRLLPSGRALVSKAYGKPSNRNPAGASSTPGGAPPDGRERQHPSADRQRPPPFNWTGPVKRTTEG